MIISENTPRNHLVKRLQSFGLHRLQKSVFIGYLTVQERLNLSGDFDLFLSSDNDSIVLFPICESCKESILLNGDTEIPEKYVNYRFL